jgi:hypothetical protein
MTTPHKLVKFEGATHFIGKCRAGGYVIHSWNLFGRNDGYCGATVCFLRDDGYYKEVDGPYLMSSGWRTEALATHLEMPELNRKAFKVTFGAKIEKRTSAGVSYDDFGEKVYRVDEFIVGSVSVRIRQEWYDIVHIKIESRHQGYSFFQRAVNLVFEG